MMKLENQKVLLTMVSLSLGLLYSTHPGAARGSHSASRPTTASRSHSASNPAQHRPVAIAMKPVPTRSSDSPGGAGYQPALTKGAGLKPASSGSPGGAGYQPASTNSAGLKPVSSGSPGGAGFQPASTKGTDRKPYSSSALQSPSTSSFAQRRFIASAGLANGTQSIEVDSALLSVLRDISKSVKTSDDATKIENPADKAALSAALAALDQAIGLGSAQPNRIVSQESKERLEGKIAPESWESGTIELPNSGHASLNVLWAKRVNGNVTISIAGDCKAATEDGTAKPIAFVVVINGKSTLDSGFDIQSQTNVHFWLGKLGSFSIDAGLPDLQANGEGVKPLHALPTAKKQVLVQAPKPVNAAAQAIRTAVPESVKPNASVVVEATKSAFVAEPPKSTLVAEPPKNIPSSEGKRLQESLSRASVNPEPAVEIMPARLQPSGENGRLEFPPSSATPAEMHTAINPDFNPEIPAAPQSNGASTVQSPGEPAPPAAASNTAPVETISISSPGNVPEATISVTPIAGDEVSASSMGTGASAITSALTADSKHSSDSSDAKPATSNSGNTSDAAPLVGTAGFQPAPPAQHLNVEAGRAPVLPGAPLVSAMPPLEQCTSRSARAAAISANSQQARTPSSTAHIVSPDRAVAGEFMTVAVVSKEQKPEPNVSVSFNGNVVTTSPEGRATFQVPEEAPPGPSLQIGLDAKPEYKAAAVHVLQPLVKSATPLTPQIDHVSEVGTAGSTVTIDGHNFHGMAEQNRVIFDARHEAKILVASPVQLKVLLPAALPPGQHAVTVATNGLNSNAGQCQMVAVQVQPMGKPERADKWMVKIVGTQNRVRVRLSNDSPDVIKLLKGNQQTVITPGGSNNLVTLNGQRINRGLPRLITSVEPLQ